MFSFSKSSYYYERKPKDDTALVDALNALVDRYPRNGFWLLFNRLRKQGFMWNHKRVYRIYKALGLNFKKRTKQRIPSRIKHPLQDLHQPNEQWSMDFMSDKLEQWCYIHSIELKFIQPGSPTQNSRMERLNGSMRRELLNAYMFDTLSEVKIVLKEWVDDYNYHRPHTVLGKLSPVEYLNRYNQTKDYSASTGLV